MTPQARVAAAIEVLDRVAAGDAAERALTSWARRSRYAGSGDRAAVRDLVFDALRCRRSLAAQGGGEDGRALMIGTVRARQDDPAHLFTGERHAPAPLTEAERETPPAPMPDAVRLDVPDWVLEIVRGDHGGDAEAILEALRHRAPVFLRANLLRADAVTAAQALARDGIETRPHPLAATALEVTGGVRGLRGSSAWAGGLVELQDAASQASVAAVADRLPGARVLDYCAGGGGKALALAGFGADVTAHDVDPARMADLPARAARAGARIAMTADPEGPYDLVFVDAPCSGSGAWRRQAEAKWRLTPEGLRRLVRLQAEIIDAAAPLVRPGGTLVYATCSILRSENRAQVDRFLSATSGWRCAGDRQYLPTEGGDGFYAAVLDRLSGAAGSEKG